MFAVLDVVFSYGNMAAFLGVNLRTYLMIRLPDCFGTNNYHGAFFPFFFYYCHHNPPLVESTHLISMSAKVGSPSQPLFGSVT